MQFLTTEARRHGESWERLIRLVLELKPLAMMKLNTPGVEHLNHFTSIILDSAIQVHKEMGLAS